MNRGIGVLHVCSNRGDESGGLGDLAACGGRPSIRYNVALAEVDKKKESMCLAEVKKPRDFTRLTQEDDSLSRGNLCNLVVS